MSKASLSVKLTCKSWQQLSAIYTRDLCRNAFFLKTTKPPPIGTQVRISLILPSDTSVELVGSISALVKAGGLNGRGPGVDIALLKLSQSVMWLIESALSSSGMKPNSSPPQSSSDKSQSSPNKTGNASALSESAMDEGAEVVSAEAELIDSLKTELTSIEKWNAFQRLNLSYDTSDEKVRAAFGELSKKYHPDRFKRYQNREVRELASEIFILLRDAYREVGKASNRKVLLDRIRPRRVSKPPPIPPPFAAKRRARTSPHAATVGPPLRPLAEGSGSGLGSSEKDVAPLAEAPEPIAGMPDIGSEIFDNVQKSSVSPMPSGSDDSMSPKVALGIRVLESGQYEQALQILKIEMRKNPNDIHARVGVELASGRLALAAGDRMEAGQRFETALDIDPTNELAAREIGEMRRHVTSQRRGLLSKLMKKI